MLLDAHGGAVAAGGHGLRRAAAAVGRNGPLVVNGAARGVRLVVLCSAPGSSAALGRVRGAVLVVYGAAASFVVDGQNAHGASGMKLTSKQAKSVRAFICRVSTCSVGRVRSKTRALDVGCICDVMLDQHDCPSASHRHRQPCRCTAASNNTYSTSAGLDCIWRIAASCKSCSLIGYCCDLPVTASNDDRNDLPQRREEDRRPAALPLKEGGDRRRRASTSSTF